MVTETQYQSWIESRRTAAPSCDLADRVMVAVEERVESERVESERVESERVESERVESERGVRRTARLADRMNDSRPIRWAACLLGLVVGSLPLLYVAYAAKLIVL